MSYGERQAANRWRPPARRVKKRAPIRRGRIKSSSNQDNHFLDKNDLIVRVYERRMVGAFKDAPRGFAYRDELERSLANMRRHGTFLRQACRMTGQNNLSDHAVKRAQEFDLAWHQSLWGSDPMPEELRMATIYHAMASTHMAMSWILSGFPAPDAELADLICHMRGIGMERLFEGAETPGNPYAW